MFLCFSLWGRNLDLVNYVDKRNRLGRCPPPTERLARKDSPVRDSKLFCGLACILRQLSGPNKQNSLTQCQEHSTNGNLSFFLSFLMGGHG